MNDGKDEQDEGYFECEEYRMKKEKRMSCLLRKKSAGKRVQNILKMSTVLQKHEILLCPELPNNQCREETGPGNRDDHVRDVKMNFSECSIVYLGTFRV